MRRFAFALALFLTFLPATSASPSETGSLEHCQAGGGYSPEGRLAQARDLRVKVAVSQEQAPGESPRVSWTLTLRNRTAETVRLSFPSSKYADVVVRRRGKVAYSWSRGRGFFTAITWLTLGPHESYVCTLGPDPIEIEDLEQGRYELYAYLNTYRLGPYSRVPVEARGWFSVL